MPYGASIIFRAAGVGTIIAAAACIAIGTPFAHTDDPEIMSKINVAAINAVLMALAFQLAFASKIATHNLQLASKTQLCAHYVVMELAYWSLHSLQHHFPALWSFFRHAVHHSVGSTAPISPIDAWFLHPYDFIAWSVCAIIPNIIPATKIHRVQHIRILTILAAILMLQHTPGWTFCTDSFCIGHPIHHAPNNTIQGKSPLINPATSLILGL